MAIIRTLSSRMGRHRAHELLCEAAQAVSETGRPLADVIAGMDVVAGKAVARVSARAYLGAGPDIIDTLTRSR